MDTIVVSRPATLTVTFDDGEDAVDPGTVTLALTRDDGTVQTVAADPDVDVDQVVTVALTATEVGDTPDRLTATWTSTTQGTIAQQVDIVGARIASLAAIRGGKATSYTVAQLAEALAWFEDLAEDHCGVAFRPRYARDRVRVTGGPLIAATWPRVREVLWATVDGVTVDVDHWDIDGQILIPTVRPGHGAIVEVGYVHGYTAPPARLVDACVVACQDWLRTQAGDRRVSRVLSETDQFGNTARMARANTAYPTGIDVVDATLNQLSEQIPGAA